MNSNPPRTEPTSSSRADRVSSASSAPSANAVAPILRLDDLPRAALDGQAVFVRVDFNVPMDGDRIVDHTRIDAALPTLRELLEKGARPVLASHRGRPKGPEDTQFSLEPVARALAERSGWTVRFAADCVGPVAEGAVAELGAGELLVLENLRFHSGEKANDPAFIAALSKLTPTYVNDAFGTAHRAHASTEGLAHAASYRAAGRLLERELDVLGTLLEAPDRPFVAILGGAKISGKLQTLERLVESVDGLAVGGGMANTFLLAGGHEMGRSLVEPDCVELARAILRRAEERSVDVVLPSDLVVTTSLENEAPPPAVRNAADGLEGDEMAVDIGPDTRARIADLLAGAKTAFWNGPMGVFERPPYDAGSVAVARALAACPGQTSIGGGETVAAVEAAGVKAEIGHVSTGGGASLELLAGKSLPGVEALRAHRNTKESNAR